MALTRMRSTFQTSVWRTSTVLGIFWIWKSDLTDLDVKTQSYVKRFKRQILFTTTISSYFKSLKKEIIFLQLIDTFSMVFSNDKILGHVTCFFAPRASTSQVEAFLWKWNEVDAPLHVTPDCFSGHIVTCITKGQRQKLNP